MKKLFTILLVLISFSSFAQFEAGEYVNSDTLKNKGSSIIYPHADSVEQFYYSKMRDPSEPLDGVNLRTLFDRLASLDTLGLNVSDLVSGSQLINAGETQIFFPSAFDSTNVIVVPFVRRISDDAVIDFIINDIDSLGFDVVVWEDSCKIQYVASQKITHSSDIFKEPIYSADSAYLKLHVRTDFDTDSTNEIQDLSGLVPFLGADRDVDLGANSISTDTVKIDGVPLLLNTFKQGNLGGASNIFYSTGAISQPASGTVNQVIGGNSLSDNYLPKWDGSKLVNSWTKQEPISYTIGSGNDFKTIINSGGFWEVLEAKGTGQYSSLLLTKTGVGTGYIASDGSTLSLSSTIHPYSRPDISIFSNGKVSLNSLTSASTRLVTASSIGQLGLSIISESGTVATVAGTISATNLTDSYLPLHQNDANGLVNSNIYQDVNGNVGVGTTTPASKLEISGGNIELSNGYQLGWRYSAGDGKMYNSIVNNYAYSGGIQYKSGSWSSNTTLVAHNFQTWMSDAWQSSLTILQNGNVGIGTTTPLSKLSINGGLHVGGDSDAGDNNILADGTIAGTQLISNIPTGTPPLVVASSTKVDSLNVGLLDGKKASDFLKYTDSVIESDTIKARADIIVTGEIYDKINHLYGMVYDSTITLSLTQNVWQQVTNATKTLYSTAEQDGITISGDTIVFSKAGGYDVYFEFNCTGINSKDYHYRILQKNGTTTVRSYNKYASTGTQVLRNEKAYIHVVAGSKVWCEIMSPSSAPGSITIQGAKVYAMQCYLEK